MKKKQLILALFAILLLSFIPQNLNLFLNSSSIVSADTPTPAWLDPAWSYRRPITIDNTLNPNALSNYQLNVNVTYVSSMKSNFDDLRFTTSDGQTLIPYWIETSNPSQSASVWVNVPAVAASAVTTIYMYYGNPNAPAYSNGQNTFDFFDTFESLGLGLSSWTYKAPIPINTADPTAAVYNGKLYVFGGYQNTATDVLGITYEYNPATDTWTKKANMPTPRWGEVAVTYNDQIYVFGGQTANLTNSTVSIPAATLVTKYANNPLSSIPQYGAGGSVHPDVIYFPEGKDGYKYWMMYTPFPPQSKENPSIVRSNDGITWTDTGITNPIIPAGSPGAFNDLENPDPDFLYVADYNKWFMVWDPGDQATDSRKIALAYSSDGKTWTQYNGASINGNTNPVILSGDDTHGQSWERLGSVSKLSCPTLYYANGTFYLYYVEEASGNNRGRVGLATFTWNNQTNSITSMVRNANNPIIDLPANNQFLSGIGHLNIAKAPFGNQFWLYGARQRLTSSTFEVVMLTSTDMTSWTNNCQILRTGASGEWDGFSLYRSCPTVNQNNQVVLFNNTVRVYYGAWADSNTPMIGMANLYPYTGDFGNLNVGSTNFWGGDVQATQFQFNGSTGTYGGSITVYFSAVAGPSNNKAVVGIYDQNMTKLAQSVEVTGLSTGWKTFPLTGTFNLVSGNVYYLVSQAPTGNTGGLVNGGQSQSGWVTQAYTGTLPTSLPTFTGTENCAYAIYCTYLMNTTAQINPPDAVIYNSNEVYDPATDTWEVKSAVPAGLANQGLMGVRYNNEIHLFYKNYHYVYYPQNDTYVRKADVPNQRVWGTCAVVNNKIYVIGGFSYTTGAASNVNQVYDPATDTWQSKTAMPASLIGVTRENPVIDGKIYVTHGLDNLTGSFHTQTYVYDPAADAWTQKSNASYPRDGTACGVINGKLYVVGGRADLPGPYGVNYNEVYDPALDVGSPSGSGESWITSNTQNVYVDASAKSYGNYGLLINDNSPVSSHYAEGALGLGELVIDFDWQMTSLLGIDTLQPQGRVLLVDPSLAQAGTLYLYNDGGTPRFKWYNGTFTTLQTASWNSWYHISIVWAGSASKVIINGTQYAVTANAPADRVRFDTSQTEVTQEYFDQVRVRKYSAIVPTINIGAEESNGIPNYNLTMYTVGQGSVLPGNGTYPSGTNISLSAINAVGWSFAGWSGDAAGTQNTTITINANKVVTATFAQSQPLSWTQTTVSDFNSGSTSNVSVTTVGQSDGDVVLASTAGGSSVSFSDNFNDGAIDSAWTVDVSPLVAQWLKIDLGASYSIDTVRVYQSNFPNYYTKDYQVQVSTDDASYTTVGSNALPSNINAMQTTTFTATNARYVKILITSYYGSGISQGLNEVEVYASANPTTNLALNKTTTASSQWPSSNYTSQHAVDGQKGTTQDTSPYPWLCADDAKATSNAVTETSGYLLINAAEYTYAHIQRDLNLPVGTQNVTVTGRMQVSGTGYSWCPKLALYWGSGDYCGIGISNSEFITNINVYATQSEGYVSYSGANPGTYYYLRIVLNATTITFSESSDGTSWQVLRTANRPASYSGQPTMLIVGKGYGNGGYSQGGYTYGNSTLNNNYALATGNMETDIIDDITFAAYTSEATTQYVSSGVFTSNVYDAGSTATWGNIYWTTTTPSGTSVTLQTRSGNTATPDGSWSNWSTVYASSGVAISSPSSRYIQYRATLQTTNTANTPVLQNVTLTGAVPATIYSVSVTVLPSAAAGTVTPNATGPYNLGDVVVLTQAPNLGYTFSGWSGAGTGTGTTRTVTVTGNMSVTATFTQNPTLNWTQTSVANFNQGIKNNVNVTTIGASDGDVVLAQASSGAVSFTDDFNDGTIDATWTVDTSPLVAQWLKIDLGAVYSIDAVKVYQSNFPYYYTKDYQVQISTDDTTYTTVGSNTLPDSINALQTTAFTATNARYIRIEISSYYTSGISQGLNEVEVYQAGNATNNLALNKTTTASSQWPSSNYAPSHAVDGQKGTTQDSAPYPWLCADEAKATSNVVAETSGHLQIDAAENTYAHIQRTLNLAAGVENVTVTTRMQTTDAGYSWCPKLALYWGSGDYCGIGIGGSNFVTNVNVYATQSEGFAAYSGATPGTYYYLKMVLTASTIEFSVSSDGTNWQVLRTVDRPSSYTGQPTMLIVGKGYGNGGYLQEGYTYGNPDLNNNYPPATGSMATTLIDDVTLTAYGSTQSQYVSSGTLVSNVFDASTASLWKNIYWTATLPAGTSLTVQTRSGNTSTPDASWSSWSTAYASSGAAVSSPSSRYLQYQVTLQTTNPTNTPVLTSISISYQNS